MLIARSRFTATGIETKLTVLENLTRLLTTSPLDFVANVTVTFGSLTSDERVIVSRTPRRWRRRRRTRFVAGVGDESDVQLLTGSPILDTNVPLITAAIFCRPEVSIDEFSVTLDRAASSWVVIERRTTDLFSPKEIGGQFVVVFQVLVDTNSDVRTVRKKPALGHVSASVPAHNVLVVDNRVLSARV